jgi:uncharacterized protein (DUF1330 family)
MPAGMLYFFRIFYPRVPRLRRHGMTAYVIVDIDVKDAETYKEYIGLAPATIAAYVGKYLARAGRTEKFEGEWLPKRLVILQFESLERAREWLDSAEYAPIKQMRHRAAVSNMVAIEGV